MVSALLVVGIWLNCAAAADAGPLLYLPLDGHFRAAASAGAALPRQVDSQMLFFPGMRGSCAHLTGDLRWPTLGCFHAATGTVAFWLRPAWSGADRTSHVLFCLYGDRKLPQPWLTNRFSLSAAEGKLRLTIYGADAKPNVALSADIHDWKPHEWRHVACAWSGVNSGGSDAACRLFVDGQAVAEKQGFKLEVGSVNDTFDIGRDCDASPDYAQADLDEFYIYGRALTQSEISRAAALGREHRKTSLLPLPTGKAHALWWNDAWPFRCRARIEPRESCQANTVFRLPLDMQADLSALSVRGELDAASVRVLPCDPRTGECSPDARPLPAAVVDDALVWQTPPGQPRAEAVQIYFGVAQLDACTPLFVETRRTAWPAADAADIRPADYAADAYGHSWDFDRDGDFANIDAWGNRPEFLRHRQVHNGLLSFDVSEDPYFIWGEMWGSARRAKRPVAIDLKKYPLLKMRVRQSCGSAEWELYGRRNDSAELLNYKFTVNGTGWQTLRIDLAADARWSGVLQAFRIDPTSHIADAHIDVDWIQLTNEASAVREAVEAWSPTQPAVARLTIDVERPAALCGSRQIATIRAFDAAGRPAVGRPVTVRLTSKGGGRLEWRRESPTLAVAAAVRRGLTDAAGSLRMDMVASRRAAPQADVLAANADFTRVEAARVSVDASAGPPHHYILHPSAPATLGESRFPLPLEVQLVDEFGNPVALAGCRLSLTATPGARLDPPAVTTDAHGRAATVLHANPDQGWTIALEGHDAAGRLLLPTVFNVALEKSRRPPIRLLPNGYFARDAQPFVPLGGFYANWVQLETPNGEWGIVKSFTDTTDEQKCRWMKFLHDNGATAMRFMLRTHRRDGIEPMDVGGRVNERLLAEALHYMDLARRFDLQFQLVIHEDYTKPMYFNQKHLELFSLPAFAGEDLNRLPPEQARFIRDRRLISPISAKYTDPDVIACQDRYVRELIPAFKHCPQVFAYELENEMVACPASWAGHAIETLRTLDPARPICVSHGGGGLLTADPLWWLRNTPIDFYTYHLYPHGRDAGPETDYGAWVDVLTRYGRMCGPSLLGESAGDEFQQHKSVDVRRRTMRDIIWLALANGNPGVFFWNARGAEVREFRLARQAMEQLDLQNFRRATPKIGVDLRHPLTDDLWFRTPEGRKAYALLGRYSQHYLSAGVDFDFTMQPEKYAQRCTLDKFAPPAPPERLFELPAGWQLSYLARDDYGQVLVYLRNFAGVETWNYGQKRRARPIQLRACSPAPLVLRWKLPGKVYRLTVYNLEKQTVSTRDVRGADSLDQGTTSHDFALILKRQ